MATSFLCSLTWSAFKIEDELLNNTEGGKAVELCLVLLDGSLARLSIPSERAVAILSNPTPDGNGSIDESNERRAG